MKNNLLSRILLSSLAAFIFLFSFTPLASASEILNSYHSSWGDYIDSQGYRHQPSYSFPEESVSDWIPLGTGGHQAYTARLQYEATFIGAEDEYVQSMLCLSGPAGLAECTLEVDNNNYPTNPPTLPMDEYAPFDGADFYAFYICNDDTGTFSADPDCRGLGGGVTEYYIEGAGRLVNVDSFYSPTGNINVGTTFEVSWQVNHAEVVNIASSGAISCTKSGNLYGGQHYSTMSCTVNSVGVGTVTLEARGPAEGGNQKIITTPISMNGVSAGAPPPPPPPPSGGTPPSSTCDDPGASNFGATATCTYTTACIDGALVRFTSYPTTLSPGQTGTFTAEVVNTGTTWWYHGFVYQLQQTTGLTSSPTGAQMNSVPPNDVSGTFTFNVTAPATLGPAAFTLRMRHTDFGGSKDTSGVDCAPAPGAYPGVLFGQAATANFTVANPTVQTSASIPTSVSANGSTVYNLAVTGTNTAGASRLDFLDFIVNYQGTNGDGTQAKARGAGKYSPNPAKYTNTVTYPTASGYKNHMACGGVGGSAVIWNTFGPSYINLVSCTATDTGPNTRRVTYGVTFNPLFATNGPLTLNDISSFAQDTVIPAANTGWQNSDINFAISSAAADGSTFVSQTVNGVTNPATITLNAGQTYPMTVTMTNSGTSIWSGTYYYGLGVINPPDTNTTWTATRSHLTFSPAETVAIGASKTFSFNITAPTTPGTYNLQWQTVHDGHNTFYSPRIDAGWFGATTNNVSVTVVPVPVVTLTASAPSVSTGLSATLSWTVSGATSCSSIGSSAIPAGVWSTGTSGNVSTGAITSAKSYRLRCTNASGTNTDSAIVTVAVSNPTVSLTASPSSGAAGFTTNLAWSTSGVSGGCTSIGASTMPAGTWSAGNTTSNLSTVINSTQTYQIRCGNGDGGFTNSASVVVTASAPSTFNLSISANPTPRGHVASSVGGINCGTISGVTSGSCGPTSIASGATVTLTATPASSYWRFVNWSGDCTGSGPCVLVVNSDKSVTANFVIRTFNYNEF